MTSNFSKWPHIQDTCDFALLTNKVLLLKDILHIIQDDKQPNTIEFSRDRIHICNRDPQAIQVLDLIPEKMGSYHPPETDVACTFQCSRLIRFFKEYTNNIVVSISKTKNEDKLNIAVWDNDTIAEKISVLLVPDDEVDYIDDSGYDAEPHLKINVVDFCKTMKSAKDQLSSDITGFAKHMQIFSQHKVTVVTCNKVYGKDRGNIIVANPDVGLRWEGLIEKYLQKNKHFHVDHAPTSVVILNHPISTCHGNVKVMNLLVKLKTLTRSDKQMLACFYSNTKPMKMELEIRDCGSAVGKYRAYILGTKVNPQTVCSFQDIPV